METEQTEQLQHFNERLSEWVANQGFWFQVRYSMSSTGMRGRAMFHLLRMGFRLLIFFVLVAAGSWIYLVKRTDSARFISSFRNQLQTGLTAKEVQMRGFNRIQGQLEISRLAAEGGTNTFFSDLEARNIRCKMGLLDGLTGSWNPGIISIARLDLDLRAGADDPESASKLAEAIFRKPSGIEANAYEVQSAIIRWGYSERTQGAIESSLMKVQRTEQGWRISFKGGVFRQNWLRGLEIVNLVILCDPNGLVFETAELKQGSGTVDFSGLRVTGGDRPQVHGIAKIHNLGLEEILPGALNSFVEGTISGDFRVFGSTNSSDGIGFEGQVVMDGNDVITLRERIHLLKAISVVDFSRNYHRIDLREGSFQMKTIGGGMELTDINLKAEDLFTLEGNISVRLPTPEEIQNAVANGSGLEGSMVLYGDDEMVDSKKLPETQSDFSLRRAALAAKRLKEGDQDPASVSLFDRLGMSMEMRRLQDQAADRMSRMLQYQGTLRITLPNDAFERAELLRQLYPVDPATNRVPLEVPLEGNLYGLTLKQAEDIYQQGRR